MSAGWRSRVGAVLLVRSRGLRVHGDRCAVGEAPHVRHSAHVRGHAQSVSARTADCRRQTRLLRDVDHRARQRAAVRTWSGGVRHRAADVARGRLHGREPFGRPAVPALGGGARQEEHGDELEGRSARAVPAGYVPARVWPAAYRQVRPDAAGSSSRSRSTTPTTARSSSTVGRCRTDPTPSWKGYSVGRWEGDTLVVDSIGFRDDLWLDFRGSPLTSAGKVRERITRPDFGHLNIEVTVDDPKAYTRPWTVRCSSRSSRTRRSSTRSVSRTRSSCGACAGRRRIMRSIRRSVLSVSRCGVAEE